MSLRLARGHRRAVDAVLALVAASGVAWLLLDQGDALAAGPRWWLRQDVRVHALAALATLFVAGTLWLAHIRRAWRARRNRLAGSFVVALLGALAGSGYLLGYFGDERAHAVIARIHWLGGLAATLVYVLHRLRGPRTRP